MKNIGAIRTLLFANFISGIAQGISMISIPAYFNSLGMSNWFGTAYMLITVVTLFWSPYAGTLVDKYNRKNIFMTINLLSGTVLMCLVAASYWQGMTPLLAIGAFAMTFWNYNIHYPSLYAFMQEITEPKHYGRIASMLEIQGQTASTLAGAGAALLIEGFTIGGWEVSKWELHQIFTLDACTYFVAFLLIMSMRFVPIAKRSKETGSTLKRMKVGLDYLRKNPYTFLFGVVSFAVFICVLVHVYYLATVYTFNHLGGDGYVFAISEVLFSGGSILAGLLIQRIFKGWTPVSAIITLTGFVACLFISLYLFNSITWFWIMSLFLGLSNAGIRVIRVSYLFTIIPNQVSGRANSIFGVSNVIFRVLFLSLFALPFFHQHNNAIYAMLIMSTFLIIALSILSIFYQKILSQKKLEDV